MNTTRRHNSRKNDDYNNLRAGTAIYDKDNKLLLVLQNNNIWSLPKGSVKYGESFYDAALRETKEEAVIDLSIYQPIAIEEYLLYGDTAYYLFIYKLPISYVEIPNIYNKTNESQAIKWVDVDKNIFRNYRVNLLTRIFINNTLDNKLFYNIYNRISDFNTLKLQLYKNPIYLSLNRNYKGGKSIKSKKYTLKNKKYKRHNKSKI